MRMASAICGTSDIVPTIDDSNAPKKLPRCAPASLPCATTASTPNRSSVIASSTVVAVPMR